MTEEKEVTMTNISTVVTMLLAMGLVAWAVWMAWVIHRGRREGCASCKLYEPGPDRQPSGLVCTACGGFRIDPKAKRRK